MSNNQLQVKTSLEDSNFLPSDRTAQHYSSTSLCLLDRMYHFIEESQSGADEEEDEIECGRKGDKVLRNSVTCDDEIL